MTAAWPSIGTSTEWNRPSAIGSRSTWMIGLYSAMPVWFENDAPNTISRSDSFMNQLAIGRATAPEHTAAELVLIGDRTLALERRRDRRTDVLGEGDDLGHVVASAVTRR